MAHGDALIFLTNIVWIFLLFIFIYLFLVVFFLPSFYKKFRIRVLVRGVIKVVSVFSVRNILVSLTFFLEFFRGLHLQILGFMRSSLFYFRFQAVKSLNSFTARGDELAIVVSNKTLFVDTNTKGATNFIKFKN